MAVRGTAGNPRSATDFPIQAFQRIIGTQIPPGTGGKSYYANVSSQPSATMQAARSNRKALSLLATLSAFRRDDSRSS